MEKIELIFFYYRVTNYVGKEANGPATRGGSNVSIPSFFNTQWINGLSTEHQWFLTLQKGTQPCVLPDGRTAPATTL